eukprot:GILK01005259.1.p1 GENE.GILK01005259.1~~GILK01005259.1.p1  ORF type:complete len:651 (-),score=154.56 GILK01005259.1:133-2085(-)
MGVYRGGVCFLAILLLHHSLSIVQALQFDVSLDYDASVFIQEENHLTLQTSIDITDFMKNSQAPASIFNKIETAKRALERLRAIWQKIRETHANAKISSRQEEELKIKEQLSAQKILHEKVRNLQLHVEDLQRQNTAANLLTTRAARIQAHIDLLKDVDNSKQDFAACFLTVDTELSKLSREVLPMAQGDADLYHKLQQLVKTLDIRWSTLQAKRRGLEEQRLINKLKISSLEQAKLRLTEESTALKQQLTHSRSSTTDVESSVQNLHLKTEELNQELREEQNKQQTQAQEASEAEKVVQERTRQLDAEIQSLRTRYRELEAAKERLTTPMETLSSKVRALNDALVRAREHVTSATDSPSRFAQIDGVISVLFEETSRTLTKEVTVLEVSQQIEIAVTAVDAIRHLLLTALGEIDEAALLPPLQPVSLVEDQEKLSALETQRSQLESSIAKAKEFDAKSYEALIGELETQFNRLILAASSKFDAETVLVNAMQAQITQLTSDGEKLMAEKLKTQENIDLSEQAHQAAHKRMEEIIKEHERIRALRADVKKLLNTAQRLNKQKMQELTVAQNQMQQAFTSQSEQVERLKQEFDRKQQEYDKLKTTAMQLVHSYQQIRGPRAGSAPVREDAEADTTIGEIMRELSTSTSVTS